MRIIHDYMVWDTDNGKLLAQKRFDDHHVRSLLKTEHGRYMQYDKEEKNGKVFHTVLPLDVNDALYIMIELGTNTEQMIDAVRKEFGYDALPDA